MPVPVSESEVAIKAPIVMLAVESITIPEARQRNAASADEALMRSIDRRGLLNPIIVHADGLTLVAGERRLDAFRKLGAKLIPARIFEELSDIDRFEAELQENMARKQLSWQEEVLAVGRFHELKMAQGFAAGDKAGGAGWTQMGTADALGLSQSQISHILAIYAEREDNTVLECPTMKGAFNLISARAERARIAAHNRGLLTASSALPVIAPPGATKAERTAALLAGVKNIDLAAKTVDSIDQSIKAIHEGKMAAAALETQRKLEVSSELVVNADFLSWAETYDGPKFDVLHIDFPWGKNYSGARTRRTGKTHIAPVYADDPDVFLALLDGLLTFQDNLAFPAAHCLFWLDHVFYQVTIDAFQSAGWNLVQPHPFIWSKGYQGIAADPKRRPRHVYEAALMFVRGDRKITKLDKDVIDCSVDEKLHLNQKPITMLRHFLGIFVDEHTAVLDPTCGSGSALAAAKLIGASRVLGVELDEANADVAKFLLQRALGGLPAGGSDNEPAAD